MDNENEFNLGVEVTLKKPDDFLLVKESLTRMGVAVQRTKTLYQTAHILHKRGKYYICHFKELFALDGKPAEICDDDLQRRNLITKLLKDWDLVVVVNPDKIDGSSTASSVKILSYKEKSAWNLVPKYTLGNK